MTLSLHGVGNLLAYLASLFVASVCNLFRACGTDARTGDFNCPGRRIESFTAKVLLFKVYFYTFFLIHFSVVFALLFSKFFMLATLLV